MVAVQIQHRWLDKLLTICKLRDDGDGGGDVDKKTVATIAACMEARGERRSRSRWGELLGQCNGKVGSRICRPKLAKRAVLYVVSRIMDDELRMDGWRSEAETRRIYGRKTTVKAEVEAKIETDVDEQREREGQAAGERMDDEWTNGRKNRIGGEPGGGVRKSRWR